MSCCAIKWCGNNSKKCNYPTDGITFHRFPKVTKIKNAWIAATKREYWSPTAYSVICSRHFTEDCFQQLNGRRRWLYNTAVPTLLLPHLINKGNEYPNTLKEPKKEKTSAITIKEEPSDITDAIETEDEPIKQNTTKQEHLPSGVVSVPEKTIREIFYRKLADCKLKLEESKRAVKRVQSLNTTLRQKVNMFTYLLKKLKRKGLITKESIDIERLKSSNKLLKGKVATLKQLLIEEKRKNRADMRNVVWCTSEDTLKSESENNGHTEEPLAMEG